jgi:hypothetical protein
MGSLLFVIFGFKKRDKDHGAAYPEFCGHCQNDVYFHAYVWRNWFHLFWIPLIPLSKTRTLTCPICGQMAELSKAEWVGAKDLASATSRFVDGDLDRRAYAKAVRKFEETAEFVDRPLDVDEVMADHEHGEATTELDPDPGDSLPTDPKEEA